MNIKNNENSNKINNYLLNILIIIINITLYLLFD